MKRLLDKKWLLLQIGIKRKTMYRKAKSFGYTHPCVVSCSQELDMLINNYIENHSGQNSSLSYFLK